MCAALTSDRQARRGICHPLRPAHQTKGCSLWRSENREGLSLHKSASYMPFWLTVQVEEEEKVLQKCLNLSGRADGVNELSMNVSCKMEGSRHSA